jgi:hypothetical protein
MNRLVATCRTATLQLRVSRRPSLAITGLSQDLTAAGGRFAKEERDGGCDLLIASPVMW